MWKSVNDPAADIRQYFCTYSPFTRCKLICGYKSEGGEMNSEKFHLRAPINLTACTLMFELGRLSREHMLLERRRPSLIDPINLSHHCRTDDL
jgi:hypothetical protein